MLLSARGKINWALAVTGRREDGYHTLDMLLQSVTLEDGLEILPAESLTLQVSGPQRVTAGENNLILKAAALLAERTGCRRGAFFKLTKRVPMGAGMGGGSADAAAALLGLNLMWELDLPQEELEAIALKLGADVPFCLRGGLARAQGVGERLRSMAGPPVFHLAVTQPGRGLSTPAVFAGFDALDQTPPNPDADAVEQALAKRDPHLLARAMGNALEPAAIRVCPRILDAIQAMEHYGALRAQMTGSGSAVIGLYADEDAAARAVQALRHIWPKTWKVRTADAGVLLRRA